MGEAGPSAEEAAAEERIYANQVGDAAVARRAAGAVWRMAQELRRRGVDLRGTPVAGG